VHNILAARPRTGIVITWARLGQHGHMHVNCQPEEYVVCVMRQFGWEQDTASQAALRQSVRNKCYWLKWTSMVFRPSPRGPVSSHPQLAPLPSTATPAFVAAYDGEMTRVCPRYTERLNCKHQMRMSIVGGQAVVGWAMTVTHSDEAQTSI
jgi:hypothetical protein